MSASVASSSIKIIGSTSFARYLVNGHIITVIGEVHLSGYTETSESSITVPELLISHAKKGARVFLEVPPGFIDSCPLIGSKNIADTYKAAVAAGVKSSLEGFDLRSAMLRSADQDALYHTPKQLSILTSDKIADIFVYPISRSGQISTVLLPDETKFSDKGQYEFLRWTYIKDLANHCDYAVSKLSQWEVVSDHSETVTIIRDLWKKLADYSILRDIFSSSKDITILCGEMHARNIADVLKAFKTI